MSTPTLDRTQLAAMMQRPRERPLKRDAIDPCDETGFRRFDWKLPGEIPLAPPFTPQSASIPGAEAIENRRMERGTVLTPGTVYRVTRAHPRFVDAGGVTWWRCWYAESGTGEERNGQQR